MHFESLTLCDLTGNLTFKDRPDPRPEREADRQSSGFSLEASFDPRFDMSYNGAGWGSPAHPQTFGTPPREHGLFDGRTQHGSRPGTPNALPSIKRDATGRFLASDTGDKRPRTPTSSRPSSPAFSSRQHELEASEHNRSASRSSSRRGSFREFFRRGSEELAHAKDIIVAPKAARNAWMKQEADKLKKELDASRAQENTVRAPAPPPKDASQAERRAKLKAERARAEAKAAERQAQKAEREAREAAARPPQAPRGLTKGEDFLVFVSRGLDPLKKKSRADSFDSDTSLTDLKPMDEMGVCGECKDLSVWAPGTPSPFKQGLCKTCWVKEATGLVEVPSAVAGAAQEGPHGIRF